MRNIASSFCTRCWPEKSDPFPGVASGCPTFKVPLHPLQGQQRIRKLTIGNRKKPCLLLPGNRSPSPKNTLVAGGSRDQYGKVNVFRGVLLCMFFESSAMLGWYEAKSMWIYCLESTILKRSRAFSFASSIFTPLPSCCHLPRDTRCHRPSENFKCRILEG